MNVIGFSVDPAVFHITAAILLTLLIVFWFVIATAAALRGATVAQPNPIAQMYGYTVCLVAVIVGLTSLASILDAAFDRAYPLQTDYDYGVSIASFEAYKATSARNHALTNPSNSAQSDTASDATLRAGYAALVDDRIAATVHRTSRTFMTSGILFATALVLFLVHWRWLTRPGGLSANDPYRLP